MEETIKLKNIINNDYLLDINNIEKNAESTDGNVYIIDNKYVMKIYDNITKVDSMTKLHIYLKSKCMNIPNIVLTKDNKEYVSLGDKYIVLYTFLDGKKIGTWFKEDNEIIKGVAKELRKIHDLTANNNIFNLKEVPFKVDESLKRKSILHFDPTKDNIFYNDKKIGFIDFDDAKYGPSIVDLAIICSLLFITKKDGIELDKIKLFINEYYNGNVDMKEVKYLKEISLLWINYIIDNNEFDTSTNESFENKRKLIDEKLNLIY